MTALVRRGEGRSSFVIRRATLLLVILTHCGPLEPPFRCRPDTVDQSFECRKWAEENDIEHEICLGFWRCRQSRCEYHCVAE